MMNQFTAIFLLFLIALNLSIPKVFAFRSVNEIEGSQWRDPEDGRRIIRKVEAETFSSSLFDKIHEMRVTAAKRPHKVSVEFFLRSRLAKDELELLSRIVRSGAGEGFKRYFVSFLMVETNDLWATAHHDPALQVKYFGLSDVEWSRFVEDARGYTSADGEEIVARTFIDGFAPHQLMIVKRRKKFFKLTIFHARSLVHEEELELRDGMFWVKNGVSGENYRIVSGRVEFHDMDGFIRADPLH